MTNALGRNTCNLSVNILRGESRVIALEALRRKNKFRSVGHYVRHLLLLGMEADSPAAALRLREIRNAAMASALLMLVCVQAFASWLDRDEDEAMRRARGQRVRVIRSAARGAARGRCELEAA